MSENQAALESGDDVALADRLREAQGRILAELRKRIVGQDAVVEQALTAVFVGGHCIVTGVPGLAKTLLVSTLAEVLDLRFSRIQFTPDLMPSDITGTEILQEEADSGRRRLVFTPGPVFGNVILADEINRTPPKTQSALLEAMQERRVTVQGRSYPLEPPFFVFATQNPIELEGTYPLPEAQLDRFMFDVVMDYLPEGEELEVVRTTTALPGAAPAATVTREEILSFQDLVRRVPVSEAVLRHAVALARATRPKDATAGEYERKWVEYGASVRAAQYLVLAAKARALLRGREHVSFDDVRAHAQPVLRHRVLTNFHAESEGVSAADVVERVLEAVPVPRSGL
jgi:MoxR-like ATPase